MSSTKISIVIPCYEMHGFGRAFLAHLLSTIASQTHSNLEVVVPDHSQNNDIKTEVGLWHNRLNIIHFFNQNNRGNSSANMNAGIKRTTGDIIKIMHQDDYFCCDQAMSLICAACAEHPNSGWGVVGFNHKWYDLEPEGLHAGVAGCPSTSFFTNDINDPILFDENLVIVNDGDMHRRLSIRYGDMIVINDLCVTIRMHEHNFMKKVADGLEQQEREYLRLKYEDTNDS